MNLPAAFLALRERFVARLPERLQSMRAQLEALDAERETALGALKRMAHSLVGAAGLHSMDALAHSAAELERLTEQAPSRAALEGALNGLERLIAQQQPLAGSEEPGSGQPRSIGLLFQSDEEMAAQSALLVGVGYAVQLFCDSDQIEAACVDGRAPDLVLMGLQFGGDDQAGLSMLDRLQRGPAAGIPVIVLSASHSAALGLAAYRAGARRVLAKPISARALSRHVSDALGHDEARPLELLALGDREQGLAQFLALLDPDQLSLSHCQTADDLFAALSAQPRDAILIDLEGMPGRDAQALIALVRDHPEANHRPIVAFREPSADDHDRAALWQAGCAALIGPETTAAEFASQLSALCRRAARSRQTIDDAARTGYEHARQREALDHHAIVSLADANGTVYETSKRHQQLSGFGRTELIGANLFEARAGMAPPEFDPPALLAAQAGEVWQGEYPMPSRDGRPCWVHGTLVPFIGGGGQAYRYMVVRTDITERRLSEAALLKAHQREMQLTAQIQDSLLVPPLPRVVCGIPLASRFEAADGVAGDFHALVQIRPGVFDILIGDVMGKGVPAALVGAAVKMSLHQCLLDLRAESGGEMPQPAAIIQALHERLCPRLIELECFVTLVYARFDQDAATVTSVGCGHPELLLFDGEGVRLLDNAHPPLGTLARESYTQSVSAWPLDSLAVLYSDGLSETRNRDGALLGQDQLRLMIQRQRLAHPHPIALTAAVIDAVARFADQQAPDDDRTLVAVLNPESGEHHLSLPVALSALDALRRFIADHTGEGFDRADSERMQLAAVEAFSNIVRHGQALSREITVRLRSDPGRSVIEFHYDGPAPVLPDHAALPPPEAMQESGYGLGLIHALCTEVETRHQAGSNCQRLAFAPGDPAPSD